MIQSKKIIAVIILTVMAFTNSMCTDVSAATASVSASAKTSSGSSDAETRHYTTTYTATIAKSDQKGYYAIEMTASGNKLIATYQKISISNSTKKTVKSQTVKFYPYKGQVPGQRTQRYNTAKLGNYTEWWD